MAATTDAFAESLAALDVGLTRTSGASFAGDLRAVVEEPAVGVQLPYGDCSLAAAGVTADPTGAELDAARTGVTPADFGIAEYGSVVVRATAAGEEPVSLFVDRHVAVLPESEVVPDMEAAIDRLAGVAAGDHGDAVLATGPSATADMGELVVGAHGPESVHVLLLEDR